ncbi:uncharacterized protein Tco025E_02197 [Trypanosoma conorhini]|uniref:Nucleotide exchange factor Fes1 domain-containing protein n=1 Tax=Trypanosoma conorhini TaxID=83891 RepID=A0A422Q6R6_9TRYP|nr:uncharacterized protein Tco025E_02197 [Trypanosoma conorhini]RNF25637.1 hypothetical protein Tco025E_02197 [Trypanosoma conorhini]
MSNDPSMNTALLNFCTSVSAGSGNGTRGAAPHRNPEELQWLKEALASVEAPERQIKRLLETVSRDEVTEDECVAALEELSELVEDVNWAIEFSLMSGHRVLLELLRREQLAPKSEQVRQAAAMVIAHSAQLNERVQKCFEEAQWQAVLLPLLREEKSPAALAALLHSCSCLCREYAPNVLLFSKAGGNELIVAMLAAHGLEGSNDKKILKRVLFLLSYLADVLDIATEDLLRCISVHAANTDEDVQTSVAQVLIVCAKKSCAIVKRVLNEVAPECPARWRSALLDEDDPRKQLVRKLEKEDHDG